MINEISVNSNNAIEMSRGQLLMWVNDLLKMNLSKIEQLGTGAVYCQLTDVLYPNKIPMCKVNWKAKFDYEYVANFKILQQTFTKIGIMKHIEVEKLVKCKYQDNLEFLQWFKKIFDSTPPKDYDPRRPDNQETHKHTKDKENKLSSHQISLPTISTSNQSNDSYFTPTDRTKFSDVSFNSKNDESQNQQTLQQKYEPIPGGMVLLQENNFQAEKEFYLNKFRELERVMEEWDTNKGSRELIEEVRRVIMIAAEVEWSEEAIPNEKMESNVF